jgi:hypothetical protein
MKRATVTVALRIRGNLILKKPGNIPNRVLGIFGDILEVFS